MAETLRKGSSYTVGSYASATYEARLPMNYTGSLVKLGKGILTYYALRGYRPNHSPPDFEEWVTSDLSAPNPSGESITDITILSSWVGG